MAGQNPTKPVEFIMNKALERARQNELLKRDKLTYERVYIAYNLNEKEEPIKPEKKRETVLVEKGGVEKVMDKNGRYYTKTGGASGPRFDMIRALESMTKFQDLEIVRIDMIGDRPFYLINFKPRTDRSRPRPTNDIEEVIVRSAGWIYIDIEKFHIKQLAGWMTRPYSRAWGFFSLTRANFDITQEELEGVVVIKDVKVIDKYSVFGFDTFERQTWEYTNYRVN
ncbi:MAG: hypothetical protein WD989_01940 [Candidatus Paceibacterota bacterium]